MCFTFTASPHPVGGIMKKIFVGGLLLAVATALALWVGAALQMPLGGIIFSGGVGTVLGLVKQGGPIARIVSFLIGFVVSWLLFGIQAALLPQVVLSQIIGAVILLAIITLVAGLSGNKMPFWALLLGSATMVGAYQTQFANAPQGFLSQSVSSAGGTLVGVALGLIVAFIMELIGADDETPATTPAAPAATTPAAPAATTPAAPAVPNDPSILPTSK